MTTPVFSGSPAEKKVLHRSNDGRRLAIATRYPDGITFEYGRDTAHDEAFYIVRGEGRCTVEGGETFPLNEGDFIYLTPGIHARWEYGPGFMDVAYFCSDHPLGREIDT